MEQRTISFKVDRVAHVTAIPADEYSQSNVGDLGQCHNELGEAGPRQIGTKEKVDVMIRGVTSADSLRGA